jgi:hypothetical protein
MNALPYAQVAGARQGFLPITKRVYNLGLDESISWFQEEPRPAGGSRVACHHYDGFKLESFGKVLGADRGGTFWGVHLLVGHGEWKATSAAARPRAISSSDLMKCRSRSGQRGWRSSL